MPTQETVKENRERIQGGLKEMARLKAERKKTVEETPTAIHRINRIDSNLVNIPLNLLEGMIFENNFLIAIYHTGWGVVLTDNLEKRHMLKGMFPKCSVRYCGLTEITLANWNNTLWE